ncbi:MAG TPA: hypothetical protein VF711_12200 [Acidimicrobiales bacterium]
MTVVIAALLATRSHSATVSRPLTLASNQVAEPTTTTIAATVLAPTIAPVPVTAPTRPLPVPPVAVVALVREPEPVQEPAPAEPDGPAPAGSAPERCAAAHQWVEAHGLVLPAGFAFRCPDPAMFADGASRWGTTCWNCGMGTGSYIAINIDRIGSSDEALRYVIAHETCHAIESIATSTTTEASADACAAAHGAPRS